MRNHFIKCSIQHIFVFLPCTKYKINDAKQRGLVEREFFQWGWKLNICNFRFFGWSNQKMVKDKVVANKNRHPSYEMTHFKKIT